MKNGGVTWLCLLLVGSDCRSRLLGLGFFVFLSFGGLIGCWRFVGCSVWVVLRGIGGYWLEDWTGRVSFVGVSSEWTGMTQGSYYPYCAWLIYWSKDYYTGSSSRNIPVPILNHTTSTMTERASRINHQTLLIGNTVHYLMHDLIGMRHAVQLGIGLHLIC